MSNKLNVHENTCRFPSSDEDQGPHGNWIIHQFAALPPSNKLEPTFVSMGSCVFREIDTVLILYIA